jgi:hypothetical protein
MKNAKNIKRKKKLSTSKKGMEIVTFFCQQPVGNSASSPIG